MKYGLANNDIDYIISNIKEYGEIEKTVIFGSRAIGNYKPSSDIDLALYGENITFDTLSSLKANLEEKGPLPYFVDVVDTTHLENEELKDHIERVGKIIYERS